MMVWGWLEATNRWEGSPKLDIQQVVGRGARPGRWSVEKGMLEGTMDVTGAVIFEGMEASKAWRRANLPCRLAD